MVPNSTRQLRNAADRVILEFADYILGPKVMLILQSGTRLAQALVRSHPVVAWDVFTLEHFLLMSVLDEFRRVETDLPDAILEFHCAPDMPDAQFDTVILPTLSRGAAELTRDLLQDAADRIHPNGRVIVSTDNPRDSWLQKQLQSIYGRVTVEKHHEGVCYIARRRTTQRKRKDFRSEFAFRDKERLIRCQSRPGVFSHRKLDGGARSLIRSLDLLPPDFIPEKIVEMGSGSGAVSTATALRFPEANLLAVDSHARAVEATRSTASCNRVTNLKVMLSCTGVVPDDGRWDLFLTNPPYYSDYRISELFLQTAVESLRPGGRIHLVTRLTDWHVARMTQLFEAIRVEKISSYNVITAIRGQ
ncbi:MAG: methyltransferase [Fuerstiella sp.]|nr:methyltransferase [Fuerstiella sp.]